MRFLRFLFWVAVVGAVLIMGARFIWPLPSLDGRTETAAIPVSAETRIGAALLPAQAGHPGLSGILPLPDGLEGFGARITMARAAEKTIDAQYYIWQTDATGYLLLDELRAAAERGVRVRLLVDDNGIPGLDAELAALDALPGMEVRIFNPFTLRAPKLLSYGFDFLRLNRRMHNKSITVDGALTIVGGRNVGDIYFAYGPDVHYFDFDLLAVGQAAADVGADFDTYWSSGSSYPADRVLAPAPDGLAALAAHVERFKTEPATQPYLEAIRSSRLYQSLLNGTAGVQWSKVTLISDDPKKGLGQAANADIVIGKLARILETPKKSVDLISAYFIPGQRGADLLAALPARGVEVTTLTNAMTATDVPVVHAAYMKYRDTLIDGGVRVLELKPHPDFPTAETSFSTMVTGSASSLHSKTFAIDGERAFVGSFNFDPRSARLNTEMGFLVENPALARAIAAALKRYAGSLTYEVNRNDAGTMVWTETTPSGDTVVHPSEPGSTWLGNVMLTVIGWLPVEWML